VIWGLKKKDTPILRGVQIYHNFIKPNGGTWGITPVEGCEIVMNLKNKWITLIQRAARAK
jgi:putative transposase